MDGDTYLPVDVPSHENKYKSKICGTHCESTIFGTSKSVLKSCDKSVDDAKINNINSYVYRKQLQKTSALSLSIIFSKQNGYAHYLSIQ
jgi:hypothetical protein